MAGIISADEAFRLLGKRIDELALIPLRAWDRYKARIAPVMGKPPARLRATAMQALMVEELEKAFEGEVVQKAGRSLLCSVPNLVVQCKKLSDRGLPQNYPTPTAQRFAAQMRIPGVPPGTRLTLGYILNSMGDEIAEVRLLAQLGDGVAWSRELTINQMVMPIASTATTMHVAATKKRTLQPKGTVTSSKKKQSTED